MIKKNAQQGLEQFKLNGVTRCNIHVYQDVTRGNIPKAYIIQSTNTHTHARVLHLPFLPTAKVLKGYKVSVWQQRINVNAII